MKRRKVYGVLQMRDGSTITIQNAQVAEYISSLIEQRDLLRAVVEALQAQGGPLQSHRIEMHPDDVEACHKMMLDCASKAEPVEGLPDLTIGEGQK